MKGRWAVAWARPGFRTALLVGLLAAATIGALLPHFFMHIEAKEGHFPWDPMIANVGPVEVTWITFAVLYGTIVLCVGQALGQPALIVRGVHAYAILMVLRMVSMELCTFEPPPTIIPLIDPVTAGFYPGGNPFLKDLFFSGHTATLALMVCIAQGRPVRLFAALATVAVGALVVVQHVHWTVDVLAAPVAVWIAWSLAPLTLRVCGWRGA